jgi:hypothetical protein
VYITVGGRVVRNEATRKDGVSFVFREEGKQRYKE